MKHLGKILLGTILLSGLSLAFSGCAGDASVGGSVYYGDGYPGPWFHDDGWAYGHPWYHERGGAYIHPPRPGPGPRPGPSPRRR